MGAHGDAARLGEADGIPQDARAAAVKPRSDVGGGDVGHQPLVVADVTTR
jgi:hypothetical protein